MKRIAFLFALLFPAIAFGYPPISSGLALPSPSGSLVAVVQDFASNPVASQITQPISIPAGSTAQLNFVVTNSSGTAVNLTGSVVLLTVKHDPSDATALISHQATITSYTSGVGYFPLVVSDTLGLRGIYKYDLTVVWPDNSRNQVVPSSTFLVLPSVSAPSIAVTVPPAQQPLALGPAFNWRGTYSGATSYSFEDVVGFTVGGATSSYIYTGLTPASGFSPTDTNHWTLLAQGQIPLSASGPLVLNTGALSCPSCAVISDSRFPPAPSTLGNQIVDNGTGAYVSQTQTTVDARNYASFAAAVSAIGGSPVTLTVSTSMAVPASVSLPRTLNVAFVGPGQLNISSGQQVTILGALTASTTQIFAGTGTVKLAGDSTQYIYPQWWGADSHSDPATVDSTAAFQAAEACSEASSDIPVFLPSGQYKITGTINIKQGVKWIGAGSQGSSWHVGTAIKHWANNADLFYMDGSGTGTDGTGGGFSHLLMIKAIGFTGGSAIHIASVDDSHRPGELMIEDTLSYNEDSSANWDHGIYIDGTRNNTFGGRGIRSINFNKVRVAGCNGTTYPNQCIYLSQVTHFYGRHVQVDVGSGTGSQGLMIDQNFDQVYFESLEDNGTLIINQPPDSTYNPNVFITGRAGTSFVNNATTVTGVATLISSSVTNNSPSFDVRQVSGTSTLNENTTVNGTLHVARGGPGNSVDTSVQWLATNPATNILTQQRSLGTLWGGFAWNTNTLASESQQSMFQLFPASASTTSSSMILLFNPNGAGWTSEHTFKSDGTFLASGDIYAGGSSGAGNVYGLVFNPNSSGIMNFGTSSNATALAIGNSSANMLIAAAAFDLTRITNVLGQPTWTNTQTFPGLTNTGSFTESEATSDSVNMAFNLTTSSTSSSGSPVDRSVGFMQTASVWDTTLLAPESVQFLSQVTGTSASGTPGVWFLASNIASAGWVTQLQVKSSGDVVATGNVSVGGSNGNGTVHALNFNPSSTGTGGFCTSSNCTAIGIGNSSAPITFAATTMTFPAGIIQDAALATTYNRMSTGALGDLLYATGTAAGGVSRLADVAAGAMVMSNGVGAAPIYSTTTWPNAATTGDVVIATGTNAFGHRALLAADIPAIAESGVTNLTTDLAAKAPLASPAFTGTPTVPIGTGTQTVTPMGPLYNGSPAVTPYSSVTTGETDGCATPAQCYTMPTNTWVTGGHMRVQAEWTRAANPNSVTAKLYINGAVPVSLTNTTSGDTLATDCLLVRTGATTATYQCRSINVNGAYVGNRGSLTIAPGSTMIIKTSVTAATTAADLTALYLIVDGSN